MTFSTFLLVYVAGGLTFIPLLLICALAFAYFAFTQPAPPGKSSDKDDNAQQSASLQGPDALFEKSKWSATDPEVTAAYFAVCREYVPGGINGKPPERSTPAGEVLIAESPSVYQSMYRSIFERGKTQIPTIEGDKKDGKAVKKARNVFFVVMRHGHLMLYDDSEQLEVRHVVSLAHHSIDLYGGGEPLSEGDLWIKRNCIRLTRKTSASKATATSKPFYLFSDNCSEKEDFYHALMLYQSAADDSDVPPRPQQFDTQDMLKLVQNLHAPDSDANSRWINAMIGRIFLAMYKTADIEDFIRAKINRKISRVPKPNFITSIQIQDIDMGDSGPVISNPRLKEMNVNGDTVIELDIKYNGGFKLQMGAVARIDLGSRLKAREVNLIMAGTLRKLSGHMLIRIKPPPSNRLWMTFETMPQIEMSIEPIVSSRQITYGIILRAIESRIREVMGETIVFPNWDDSPFLDTSRKEYRGGIFERNAKNDYSAKSKSKSNEAQDHVLETAVQELAKADDSDPEDPSSSSLKETRQKTMSMPSLFDPVQKASLRKAARKSVISLTGDNTASTSGASTATSSASTPGATSPPQLPARKPKTMRSNSFASAATPLVSTEGVNIEALKPDRSKRNSRGAVDLVKEVNTRNQSQISSPTSLEAESGPDDVPPFDMDRDTLVETPEEDEDNQISDKLAESNTHMVESLRRLSEPATPGKEIADPGFATPRSPSTSSIPISVTKSPSRASTGDSSSHSAPSPSHLSTAANAAKKWGLQVLNRQSAAPSPSALGSFSFQRSGKNSTTSVNSTTSLTSLPTQPPNPDALKAAQSARGAPMGRGQPLPPPGTPLPGPPGQKSLWSTSALNLGMGSMKRKPVPGPALPPRGGDVQPKKVPPPLPARKQSIGTASIRQGTETPNETTLSSAHGQGDSMLVVGVPEEDDSLPTTPIGDVFDGVAASLQDHDPSETVISAPTDGEELALPEYSQGEQQIEAPKVADSLSVPHQPVAESSSTETIKPVVGDGPNSHTHAEDVKEKDHAADYSSEAQWAEEGREWEDGYSESIKEG